MAIKLTGDEVAKAYKDWIAEELKTGPMRRFEIGRFLFTVASASIAVFIGFAGAENFSVNPWLSFCTYALFLFCAAIGIFIFVPKFMMVEAETDIHPLHQEENAKTRLMSWMWFGFWVAGIVVGGLALVLP